MLTKVYQETQRGMDYSAAEQPAGGRDVTAVRNGAEQWRVKFSRRELYAALNRDLGRADHSFGRSGDWLQTFTGRQFFPMDPRPDEVFIEDIAHSLSMQCRYAGHCLRFYSVAEHSVLLTRYFRQKGAPLTTQLWALLHDASEAYLVDVPRPVKPYLEGYRQAEAAVMRAICERFGLPIDMPEEVHAADGAIIGDERFNMAPCVAEWYATGSGLGVFLRNWTPEVAESEFLDEFHRIQRARQEDRRKAA